MLKKIPGLQFVEMAGADVCCGGGGTFQWEHPDVSTGITGNKVKAIKDTGADLVASGCPGCRLQIFGNLGEEPVQVVHPVELCGQGVELKWKEPLPQRAQRARALTKKF